MRAVVLSAGDWTALETQRSLTSEISKVFSVPAHMLSGKPDLNMQRRMAHLRAIALAEQSASLKRLAEAELREIEQKLREGSGDGTS